MNRGACSKVVSDAPSKKDLTGGGRDWTLVCVVLVVTAVTVRFIFAALLLPSPVGDSIVFLEPIYRYCHNNELVAHLFPIDPLGKDRFDWHGPLPAMLFHFSVPGCTVPGLFLLRMAFFLAIPLSLFALVARRKLPPAVFLAASLFCLAFYEKFQFRPDCFAIIFMVLSYCTMRMGWFFLEGALAACAFACGPVSGALYGLVRLTIVGLPGWRDGIAIVAGGLSVLIVVALLYPFPIADLIVGMRANANIISGRQDGDLFTYYIRSDFLPLWGVSIVVLIAAVSVRRPVFLLLVPLIWFFGVRVPPTNYNLVAIAVAASLMGYSLMSRAWKTATIAALLIPAMAGLIQLSLRDYLSVRAYPDSFARTRAMTRALVASGRPIVAAPAFAILTNPELDAEAGRKPLVPSDPTFRPGLTEIVADNGSQGKCPAGASSTDAQPSGLFVFNSSSSWAVRVCETQ